jgi:hypothetical protein
MTIARPMPVKPPVIAHTLPVRSGGRLIFMSLLRVVTPRLCGKCKIRSELLEGLVHAPHAVTRDKNPTEIRFSRAMNAASFALGLLQSECRRSHFKSRAD